MIGLFSIKDDTVVSHFAMLTLATRCSGRKTEESVLTKPPE